MSVTIEIEASMPDDTPNNVVRTVTENSRTLRFASQGLKKTEAAEHGRSLG